MLERSHRATIAGELEQAVEQLERAGVTAQARREATLLWAAVTGVSPGEVWLRRDRTAPPEVERFRDAVARRSNGVPFAYAVGRVSFRRVELRLDPRALIPRPETEGLVDLVLDWAREAGKREGGTLKDSLAVGGKGGVVADIGTGCGCIALALAVEGDFDRVIAVERSAGAATLARENVALVRPPYPSRCGSATCWNRSRASAAARWSRTRRTSRMRSTPPSTPPCGCSSRARPW